MIRERPYQEEAKNEIFKRWNAGDRATLMVLPTGCGKTIVFAKVAEQCVQNGERVLVLAHRGELLEQARDKIKSATSLETALEKAGDTAIESDAPIVVASVQTLARDKRLKAYPTDHFGKIIIDEAHHAAADTYKKILNRFPKAQVLGVTATPSRGDMKNLSEIFDSIAYEYSLKTAIADEYLCPISTKTIQIKLDITKVGIQAGDFKAAEVDNALEPYLVAIAEQMQKYCKDRKTVVFLPLVETSKKFANILNEKGFKAAEINGSSYDRSVILEKFSNGEYNVLCNAMLLTEGWDCPSVDCVVVLRPTKVKGLYCQMVGRGTRLNDGKKNLLLLDFLWLSKRMDLCHPATLICSDEEVERRMTDTLKETDEEELDLLECEEKAKSDIVRDREEQLAIEITRAEELARIEAAEKEKEIESLREKAREMKLVDPIRYAVSVNSEEILDYHPVMKSELRPISYNTLKKIIDRGIDPERISCMGYAKVIIDTLNDRRKKHLTTPKQIRFLENKGFYHVGRWMFADASNLISFMSDHSWKLPFRINKTEFSDQLCERAKHKNYDKTISELLMQYKE